MLRALRPLLLAGLLVLGGAAWAQAQPDGITATTGAIGDDCARAERGDPEAAYRLGRRFLFGDGLARDRNLGLAWMRAAASRGQVQAARLLTLVPTPWGQIRPWCRGSGEPVRPLAPAAGTIARLVQEIAPAHGLDPQLVLAVIQVESAYRTDALSPKEAAGLMQLIPATQRRFGVRNPFDPADNIRGGVLYLRWLLAYFRGDLRLALAGYNAGEGAVEHWGGVPPYTETSRYVSLITRLYGRSHHQFDPQATAPSRLVAPPG